MGAFNSFSPSNSYFKSNKPTPELIRLWLRSLQLWFRSQSGLEPAETALPWEREREREKTQKTVNVSQRTEKKKKKKKKREEDGRKLHQGVWNKKWNQ